MVNKISMNAVAFQDGEAWVVQGIEYNLVAMARTVQDIPKAFTNALVERMVVAEHLGVDPFEGVGAAPQRFREMYDEAMTELTLARPVGRAQTTVRLVEAA